MPNAITAPIRNLAELKRRIQVGVVFRCEHHTRPEVGGRRRVTQTQATGFYYEPLEGIHAGRRCHMSYGKAGDWVFNNDGSATHVVGKTSTFTYNTFTYYFDHEVE